MEDEDNIEILWDYFFGFGREVNFDIFCFVRLFDIFRYLRFNNVIEYNFIFVLVVV